MALRMRDIKYQLLALGGLAIVIAMVTTMWRRREVVAPPPIRSVAIVPFAATGPGARAMAMTLAVKLMEKVSSLAAVRALDDDVDAVLEGTLEVTDARIRVHARFIRVRDSQLLWERTLDYPLRDVGKVEESLSEALLDSVAPRKQARRLPARRAKESR